MLSVNGEYNLKSDFFLSKNEYSRKFYNFIKSNHIILSVKNNEIELYKQEKFIMYCLFLNSEKK